MTDTHEDGSGDATGSAAADLPVVESDALESASAGTGTESGTVAGVLLAAGTGSRFAGGNKLLATVDGEPIVRRAVRTLLDAPVDPVVVVTGHEAGRVRDALDGLPVREVLNDAYEAGQATSLRAGVRALDDGDGDDGSEVDDRRAGGPRVDAAVFALGDMPFVDPSSVRALVAAYRTGAGSALAAACGGERGNPVLFDRRYFDRLADVDGDVGGREILLAGDDGALVETGDPGVRRDVDTRADLVRARSDDGA